MLQRLLEQSLEDDGIMLPFVDHRSRTRPRAPARRGRDLWVCADDVSEGMAGEIAAALRLGVPVYRIDVGWLLSRVGRDRMGSGPMGAPTGCRLAGDHVCGVPAWSGYYTVDAGRALTGHEWIP